MPTHQLRALRLVGGHYQPMEIANQRISIPEWQLSLVVWEERGQYPDLIIEWLSDSTAKTDKNLKKTLYQDRFRTPEYFWLSPETLEFEGYHLVDQRYEPNSPK